MYISSTKVWFEYQLRLDTFQRREAITVYCIRNRKILRAIKTVWNRNNIQCILYDVILEEHFCIIFVSPHFCMLFASL